MSRTNDSGREKRPRSTKSGDRPAAARNASRKSSGAAKSFKKNDTGERNFKPKFAEKTFTKKESQSSDKSGKSFAEGADRNSRSVGSKLFSKSEAADYEKRMKSAAGRKAAKTSGSRDKFKNGNAAFDKKPYKKFDDRNEDRAKNFVQKRRLSKIEKDVHKDTIRLNKYIANSGVCSRREADNLITQGLVEVNGKVVTEMGYQVQKSDRVVFDGNSVTPEKPVYVLLNKPKGFISTTKDDKARKTVMDLVANASPYRVFPVGRLDRSTTGVILLTNDGHLTKKLTHPAFGVRKIYHVVLDRKVSVDDIRAISEGIRLDEGIAQVDSVSYIEGKPKNEIGIELHIGWNRVVRRIFQKLGYEVEALDRVMFAGLTKKSIPRGHWRILTELEVSNLRML